MVLDEIVGVLLDVFAVHQTVGQLQHLDGELGVVQQLQRPLGGQLTGIVVVVAQHQLLGEAAQKAGLLHRQRRTHGGHGVVKSRLMQRHHVQIALAEDDVGALRLFRQIQPVEDAALAVCNGLGGVHVLRLGVVDDAAAEAHHVAPRVDDRQHQTVAELVVQPPVLTVDHQTRRQQLLLGVALARHGGEQTVPTVGGRAHAEADGDAFPDLPSVQITLHRLALRGAEQVIVPAGGVPVQLQHTAAQPVRVGAFLLLRHRQVGALGQKPHGLGKGQVFDLHDEVDNAAALLAAEAVVDLLVRRHGEGGRLFVVERTQAEQVAALALQGDVAGHHIHDVAAGDELVQKALIEHENVPPLRKQVCMAVCNIPPH